MAKNIGYGSALAVTSTTGALTVGQIKNISAPGTDATDVDTTTLDSSTNYRTFAAAPIDPGELSMTLVYDPALLAHQRLSQYHSALDVKTWTITYNTTGSDTQAFSAYIKSMGAEIPMDDVISLDVSLKVTGSPAYATTT